MPDCSCPSATARRFADWAPRVRAYLEKFCGGPGSGRPGPCPTTLASGSTVTFTRHPSARRDEPLVMVDPQRADAAWARDKGYYLPTHEAGKSEVPGRREDFQRFLATGKPVQAPRAVFDQKTGEMSFIDGRHRFAVLRDAGANAVPIHVPGGQAKAVRQQFGVRPDA